MTKYKSITTPEIEHDAANMLTEFIFLNRNINFGSRPWQEHGKDWGRTVSCIRKLIRDFELDPNQIAFYIYRCRPSTLSSSEFGKMAVVAKKLFKKFDLQQLHEIYIEKRKEAKGSGLEQIQPKQNKPKSLRDFLEELENGEEE